MKNLLWLSHLLPYPPKGGVLQRSYNLIKEVSKRHRITLLAFNQRDICPTPRDTENAVKELKKFCDVVEVFEIPSEQSPRQRLELILSGLLPNNTYTINWLSSKAYHKAVREKLSEKKFDAIHVDTISLAPYAQDIIDTKKVLNHHNIESEMMLRRASNEKNPLKKFYFFQEGRKLRSYEEKICKKFSLNVTCSDLDIDRLKKIAPLDHCECVPNGVDLNYFYPMDMPVDRNSMVFAGGMNWYPNSDAMKFFLNAVWPDVKTSLPEVKLTIVGKSPPTWMQELAEKEPNLEVTGFLEDVRPVIAKSGMYICPIRDGGGTKLKVLDALAMGKILIADPIACEGIDVVDGVSVIFAETSRDYLDAIKFVLENPVEAEKIGKNGRHLIESKYNFSAIGNRLSDLYELTEP